MSENNTPKPEQYEASKQKGKPGHCFAAQVFDKAGKSLIMIEPTEDENVASALAESIAVFLNGNSAELTSLREENTRLRGEIEELKRTQGSAITIVKKLPKINLD